MSKWLGKWRKLYRAFLWMVTGNQKYLDRDPVVFEAPPEDNALIEQIRAESPKVVEVEDRAGGTVEVELLLENDRSKFN